MTVNIVEVIEAHVTPDQVAKIARSTGESAVKTRRATSSAVLAIMSGVIHRASSAAGAAKLLATLKSPRPGASLAPSLLGDRGDQLTAAVARASGVSRSAAYGVMGVLLPIVASVLGREVTSRKLDAFGLSEMMRAQRHVLLAHAGLPPGLGGMLGIHETIGPNGAGSFGAARMAGASPPELRPWVPITLILGVLGFGALVVLCGRRPPKTELPSTEPAYEPLVEMTITSPDLPAFPKLLETTPSLPAGAPDSTAPVIITSAELTDHAADFTPSKVPERIPLEGVTFDFGTTTLSGGEDVVDQLALVMKTHPSMRVRLEGFKGRQGDPHLEAALSFGRVLTLKRMLVDKGVDGRRIEAVARRDATDESGYPRIDLVILER